MGKEGEEEEVGEEEVEEEEEEREGEEEEEEEEGGGGGDRGGEIEAYRGAHKVQRRIQMATFPVPGQSVVHPPTHLTHIKPTAPHSTTPLPNPPTHPPTHPPTQKQRD